MNLTQVYQRTRTILGDTTGLKFRDELLESALRAVLALINAHVPKIITREFQQHPTNNVLTLTTDVVVHDVLSVMCLDSNPIRSLNFNFDPNQPTQIDLEVSAVFDQECHWQVKLVTDQQIEGLDGAVFSTIPTSCEMLLAYGVAARALQMRNTQLAESANQASSRTQTVERLAVSLDAQFMQMLHAWQQSQPAATAVLPSGSGWQLE
jgi:hypothetical protein